MKIKGKKIAFGLTSSFYAFKNTISEMEKIIKVGGEVIPIMSMSAYTTDSKFGNTSDFIERIENITKKKVINSILEAEEVEADIMVIAPCSR